MQTIMNDRTQTTYLETTEAERNSIKSIDQSFLCVTPPINFNTFRTLRNLLLASQAKRLCILMGLLFQDSKNVSALYTNKKEGVRDFQISTSGNTYLTVPHIG